MPHSNYPDRLTDKDILRLFKTGRYKVCQETWKILNKNDKPIRMFPGGSDKKYMFVTIYDSPKHRTISVCKLIWMVINNRVVPKGFEIHHNNRNPKDRHFKNLFCLSKLDHDKLHGRQLSKEEIPF